MVGKVSVIIARRFAAVHASLNRVVENPLGVYAKCVKWFTSKQLTHQPYELYRAASLQSNVNLHRRSVKVEALRPSSRRSACR